MVSFTLKRHNSFQNENERKATHNFAPRSLTFKLEQEVLKFDDICMVTNFLSLENRSFEDVSFSPQ